jgi:hypothetical protein
MNAEILTRIFRALHEHGEEAERHLDRRPTTPESSVDTALFLLSLSEASRRGIRTAQCGLIWYRSIEEAGAARERHAREQLQRADREAPRDPASSRR